MGLNERISIMVLIIPLRLQWRSKEYWFGLWLAPNQWSGEYEELKNDQIDCCCFSAPPTFFWASRLLSNINLITYTLTSFGSVSQFAAQQWRDVLFRSHWNYWHVSHASIRDVRLKKLICVLSHIFAGKPNIINSCIRSFFSDTFRNHSYLEEMR